MKKILTLFLVLALTLTACGKKDKLSARDRQTVDKILAQWQTWVPAKKAEGSAPLINFDQLYQGLDAEQKKFLDMLRNYKPGGKFPAANIPLEPVVNQVVQKDGRFVSIDKQYLPKETYDAFRLMMGAMQADLQKQLLVESGYRSPAYQLYTFVFYMPKHGYSIKETNRWVALPGHSEHGNPDRQAIDFINAYGINGDDEGQTVESFEKLPEFEWLKKRAKEFGFEMSYPRGQKDTTYEPWHWRYVRKQPANTSS